MSGGKVSLCDFSCVLVGLQRLVGGFFAFITESELSQVTVVVALPILLLVWPNHKTRAEVWSLHLVIENLGLARLRRRDQVFVKDF